MWLWHHNVTLFTAEATQLLRGRRALFCHCPFIVAVPSRRRDQEAWRPVVDPHHPHPDHDARGVSPRDPPGVPPGYSPSAGKNQNAQIWLLPGPRQASWTEREICALGPYGPIVAQAGFVVLRITSTISLTHLACEEGSFLVSDNSYRFCNFFLFYL